MIKVHNWILLQLSKLEKKTIVGLLKVIIYFKKYKKKAQGYRSGRSTICNMTLLYIDNIYVIKLTR